MDDELELYKKHRPTTFKEVLGQEGAVKSLLALIKKGKLQHSILLSGPSGCGKTTIARILKKKLDCSDMDFDELNCADVRGIDTIREIRRRMNLHPIGGKVRIYLIDEAHMLTKEAQNALLKMLEDTPRHVYFIFCTTEVNKILETIRTRSAEVKLKSLSAEALATCLKTILDREDRELSEDVLEKLVEVANGSARKAIVILHQIIDIEEEADQLEAISASDVKEEAIQIARLLLNPRTKWKELAAVLKAVDKDAEGLRRMILAYARGVLLGGGKMAARANTLINRFESNFYDGGDAALASACYEMVGK